jgi:hypothetical protein
MKRDQSMVVRRRRVSSAPPRTKSLSQSRRAAKDRTKVQREVRSLTESSESIGPGAFAEVALSGREELDAMLGSGLSTGDGRREEEGNERREEVCLLLYSR